MARRTTPCSRLAAAGDHAGYRPTWCERVRGRSAYPPRLSHPSSLLDCDHRTARKRTECNPRRLDSMSTSSSRWNRQSRRSCSTSSSGTSVDDLVECAGHARVQSALTFPHLAADSLFFATVAFNTAAERCHHRLHIQSLFLACILQRFTAASAVNSELSEHSQGFGMLDQPVRYRRFTVAVGHWSHSDLCKDSPELYVSDNFGWKSNSRNASIPTGFTKCMSNPASSVLRRSSSRP